MRLLRSISFVGGLFYLVTRSGVMAAPQVQEAAREDKPARILLENSAGTPHPKGTYRFILRTDAKEKLNAIRLWVARSATPEFRGATWEAVPMQEAPRPPGNPDAYPIVREAEVALGSKTRKYLAVRGEVEVIRQDGSLQRFSSDVTVLPNTRAWSLRNENGSRMVYVQPSEAAQAVRLWVAFSATRDFRKAKWQALPVTLAKVSSWRYYQVEVPTASRQAPWVAVYGETELEGVPGPVRVLSPTLIWNGLSLPANAHEITVRVCPLHGTSEGAVPVIYGIPGAGAPKDAVFAGCIVGPGSPTWHCKLCDCSWGDASRQSANGMPD